MENRWPHPHRRIRLDVLLRQRKVEILGVHLARLRVDLRQTVSEGQVIVRRSNVSVFVQFTDKPVQNIGVFFELPDPGPHWGRTDLSRPGTPVPRIPRPALLLDEPSLPIPSTRLTPVQFPHVPCWVPPNPSCNRIYGVGRFFGKFENLTYPMYAIPHLSKIISSNPYHDNDLPVTGARGHPALELRVTYHYSRLETERESRPP